MPTPAYICYLRAFTTDNDSVPDEHDPRLDALRRWLRADLGLDVTRLEPASSDASFRRYFRVDSDRGRYIAMDAPPGREDCEPFVRIAGYLEAVGLNAPRLVAGDAAAGFLLLTDLGERQYLAVLEEAPARAGELYADAIDALVLLQQKGIAYQSRLPPYDAALLDAELALFRDWLCGRHLALDFDEADEAAWRDCGRFLVDEALAQPRVFVHRDYHSRNLMVCEAHNPGVLDFQDAVEGPYTYDLVSLLKDCYLRLPTETVRELALGFFRRMRPQLSGEVEEGAFLRQFELMGVQRHLKAAGIFARLKHRDGKSAYLGDVPRTLGYVTELAGRYPALDFLTSLVETRVLPALGEPAGEPP